MRDFSKGKNQLINWILREIEGMVEILDYIFVELYYSSLDLKNLDVMNFMI